MSRSALLVDGQDDIFRAFIHALLAFSRRLDAIRDRLAELCGVSPPQFEILMAVAQFGGETGMSVGSLARRLHRSGTFATTEAGKLVTAGLLAKARDRRDRRRTLLRLTASGRASLAAVAPGQQQINDELFAWLGRAELQSLAGRMDGIIACADSALAMADLQILRQHANGGAPAPGRTFKAR